MLEYRDNDLVSKIGIKRVVSCAGCIVVLLTSSSLCLHFRPRRKAENCPRDPRHLHLDKAITTLTTTSDAHLLPRQLVPYLAGGVQGLGNDRVSVFSSVCALLPLLFFVPVNITFIHIVSNSVLPFYTLSLKTKLSTRSNRLSTCVPPPSSSLAPQLLPPKASTPSSQALIHSHWSRSPSEEVVMPRPTFSVARQTSGPKTVDCHTQWCTSPVQRLRCSPLNVHPWMTRRVISPSKSTFFKHCHDFASSMHVFYSLHTPRATQAPDLRYFGSPTSPHFSY